MFLLSFFFFLLNLFCQFVSLSISFFMKFLTATRSVRQKKDSDKVRWWIQKKKRLKKKQKQSTCFVLSLKLSIKEYFSHFFFAFMTVICNQNALFSILYSPKHFFLGGGWLWLTSCCWENLKLQSLKAMLPRTMSG